MRCSMNSKQPLFQITNNMIDYVAEIAELVGKMSLSDCVSNNASLCRGNRIRTIYSSLAIEKNTLGLEQVIAVLNGKQIFAPPKDIAKVKNTYELYERLDKLNPYSVDDLLMAHGIMMHGLVEESEKFRFHPTGVMNQEGYIVHCGVLPQYMSDLVKELLDWTKNSDLHMLIRSCVFHYEFDRIHPFIDENRRLGRLWHTLLLSQWNSDFAWIPVDSIIYSKQKDYYAAINKSNDTGESTVFIEFMLSVIKTALVETISSMNGMEDKLTDKASIRSSKIESYLKNHNYIMNANVRALCDVSAATANRILGRLVEEGTLIKCRVNGHWAYQLM